MSAPALLRPRSNVEILDASVELIRRHFATLATVVVLWQLPPLVVNLLWPVDPKHPFASFRDQPVLAAARWAFFLTLTGVFGLMFVRVVDELLHGRAVRLDEALRRSVARALPATAAYLLKYLVIVLWFLLLFVPAIWAAARYFAVFTAMEIEGLGPLAAIGRSKEIARGNNLRVLATVGIPIALVWLLMLFLQQVVMGMLGGPRMLSVAQAISAVVLYPFMMVPGILLYYDIRTRREGLDLDVAALPPTPSPSPSAAA